MKIVLQHIGIDEPTSLLEGFRSFSVPVTSMTTYSELCGLMLLPEVMEDLEILAFKTRFSYACGIARFFAEVVSYDEYFCPEVDDCQEDDDPAVDMSAVRAWFILEE